jgi:hypothetical protein
MYYTSAYLCLQVAKLKVTAAIGVETWRQGGYYLRNPDV